MNNVRLTVVANRSKAQPKVYTIKAISQPVARSTDFSVYQSLACLRINVSPRRLTIRDDHHQGEYNGKCHHFEQHSISGNSQAVVVEKGRLAAVIYRDCLSSQLIRALIQPSPFACTVYQVQYQRRRKGCNISARSRQILSFSGSAYLVLWEAYRGLFDKPHTVSISNHTCGCSK
jgi:hypothetical protein